ncbi:ABC transporter substrate-binding protein [Jannaschia seohaensis]|uniref:Iron complex transport system substrate-binding protein n=1 Tax=Jannaschia seohaensis TaxID=475081 RepID=A0A2Y9C8M3_9RHOB|nr:ABC transporter substrate-binding protein [Jannaschia seohaensis]PWJ15885.1 iron complex transport system substrate-binding protein [Jannaschia seohaensis]SSA49593.1 iron complex transport system substrate-binding protein [Jannaschia seohaensis]
MRLIFPLLLTLGPPALAYPVTVQSCDREVTFGAAPQAAVSNDINLTEMMLVLGLTDHMVGYTGISGWNKLDTEMRAGVAQLPELSAKYPSKEVLLGAGTDFFFAGWNYGMKVGGEVTPETLAAFDIPVYELTESCAHIMETGKASMEDMYADLLALGTIFGVSERAEELVAGYRATLEAMRAELPPLDRAPRVFVYDSGEDTPFTAGRYAMPTALIEAAGGKNVMDGFEKSWATVGWEAVIEADPEIVLIVNYGDVTAEQKRAFLMENPAFADISAVRNARFVTLDYVEATPGPRNIGAVKTLAEAFRAE